MTGLTEMFILVSLQTHETESEENESQKESPSGYVSLSGDLLNGMEKLNLESDLAAEQIDKSLPQ